MEIPELFVEWWAHYASSNTDLASLSNVNRKWRGIVVRVLLEQEKNSSSTLLLLPSMVRSIMAANDTHETEEKETFCAAWFHPAGIQIQQLAVPGEVRDDGDDGFAPSGVPFYAGSEDERTERSGRSPRGRTRVRQPEGPLCSHEWQGYRDPMDVLDPFGYASHFVEVSVVVVVVVGYGLCVSL